MQENLHKIFTILIGEKKLKVIEILLSNIDNHGFVCLKISEICELTKASKPTVIETIKLLENKKILSKIKNGVYKFELK